MLIIFKIFYFQQDLKCVVQWYVNSLRHVAIAVQTVCHPSAFTGTAGAGVVWRSRRFFHGCQIESAGPVEVSCGGDPGCPCGHYQESTSGDPDSQWPEAPLRKAKRQGLLTCKVSRYCLLALHGAAQDSLQTDAGPALNQLSPQKTQAVEPMLV